MYISTFDWDEKNEEHISKHGVSIYEVEEVILFCEPLYQRGREGKYIAYGVTEERRYLFMVFVIKDTGRIRVITARDMNRREKSYYKKRKRVR